MSTPHRPFGVPPDDHDLDRKPRADAPNDADALDAWLNEIAHDGGLRGPRSGIGQYRPDARIDDHDATDADSLIETAARFHRRVEEAHAATPRATSPDPQLWETIMERISTPTTAATGTIPLSAPQRMRRPSAPPTITTTRQRAAQRQRAWNMAANIGLVAAILLALFGTWRLVGTPGMPGSDDGTQPVSHMAMQHATPGGTPTVTAPAVGTPAPATACDLSEDIPIFNGVDESPWDGTAVLRTTSGEVVLTCPEEPNGTVLMETSRHNSIGPLEWPGVVKIPSFGEKPEEARDRVLNLATGEVVEFGFRNSPWMAQSLEGQLSPWHIGPAVDNPESDFILLDLRTFQQRQLSDIAGSTIPDDAGIMMSASMGDTLVVGLRSRSTVEGNGTLITDSAMPGDLLIVNGSLDAASWISIPDDFPPITQIIVSPDGTHVALHGVTDQLSSDRKDVYSIVHLSDGKEIDRSSVISDVPEAGDGIWLQGGAAFAYLSGNQLLMLPIDANLPEQNVFTADGPLSQLRTTVDESTVLVRQTGPEELATMEAMGQSPRLYTVNIATQDALMFPGLDVSDNVGWWTPPDRFLVMYDYQVNPRDAISYKVIDAVTGKTVGSLDDVPLYDPHDTGYPSLGRSSVAESPNGDAEIIAFDSQHTYLMRLVDGQYDVRQLTPPQGILAETPMMLSMQFSPNGSLVSMSAEGDATGTHYLLDPMATDPAWQAAPEMDWEGRMLPFVAGLGTAKPEESPITTGEFDFSEVPDGTEFMDSEELAAELRAAEDKFSWPAGYDPDVEAMIAQNAAPENSRFQEGMAYTSLGIYNQCAWYQTWLDAEDRGDEATQAEALRVMTDEIPYFSNHSPSPSPFLIKVADSAANGETDMVQQYVTVNCQGMFWE